MTNNRRRPSNDVRKFKGETVYDWDAEPSIMRPTGFEHSTVPSSLWEPSSRFGPSTLRASQERARARRRGFSTLAIALVVVVAATAAILAGVARYLHARPAATAVTARQAAQN